MPSTSSIQNLGRTSQPATLAPAAPSFFGLDNATLGGLSLLIIILFIFLPSTIFSILVRRWAEKKAHDYLERDDLSTGNQAPRIFFNTLGGSLTLLSVQLPWMTINGTYPVSVESGGIFAVIFFWALAGAILSFLSRFGGAMTLVGLIGFMGEPYISYRLANPGLGVLLAFAGAILTFAGVRWSIPSEIVRRHEIVGGVLYSVGFLIILTVVVTSFVYGGLFSTGSDQLIVAAPLLLIGIFMTGLGLKLFLTPERRQGLSAF